MGKMQYVWPGAPRTDIKCKLLGCKQYLETTPRVSKTSPNSSQVWPKKTAQGVKPWFTNGALAHPTCKASRCVCDAAWNMGRVPIIRPKTLWNFGNSHGPWTEPSGTLKCLGIATTPVICLLVHSTHHCVH